MRMPSNVCSVEQGSIGPSHMRASSSARWGSSPAPHCSQPRSKRLTVLLALMDSWATPSSEQSLYIPTAPGQTKLRSQRPVDQPASQPRSVIGAKNPTASQCTNCTYPGQGSRRCVLSCSRKTNCSQACALPMPRPQSRLVFTKYPAKHLRLTAALMHTLHIRQHIPTAFPVPAAKPLALHPCMGPKPEPIRSVVPPSTSLNSGPNRLLSDTSKL